MKPYYDDGRGIVIYHGDCREILPSLAPVDLLLTDPPYGIEIGRVAHAASGDVVGHGHRRAAKRSYELSTWDDTPPSPWVFELMREKSTQQIIFGGNYFPLPPSRCWLVWDKLNGDNNFADCELAWTNLDKAVRKIEWLWNGFARQDSETRYDHPTQKPVGVMSWAITQAPDDVLTILDPFAGSCSTLVAAKKGARKAIGIEISEEYCEIGARRLSQEVFTF